MHIAYVFCNCGGECCQGSKYWTISFPFSIDLDNIINSKAGKNIDNILSKYRYFYNRYMYNIDMRKIKHRYISRNYMIFAYINA